MVRRTRVTIATRDESARFVCGGWRARPAKGRKRQRTACPMHAWLRELGYRGIYVCAFVRRWQRGLASTVGRGAFVLASL